MNRKTYIHKMQHLLLAIYNHAESFYPENYKIGLALKRVKEAASTVPVMFGSYDKAWNSETLKWARNYYLKEEIENDDQ